MSAAVYAIPDLHGRLDLLDAAVAAFPEAHFVSLGDAIDRGPDSLGCVARLLELRAQGRATLLMGNHEYMALDGLRRYRRYTQSHDLEDYRGALRGFAWWSGNGGDSVRREAGGFGVERFPNELVEYLDALEYVVYVDAGGQVQTELPAGPSVLLAHASPPVNHRDYPSPEVAALWLRPYEGPYRLPPGVVYSAHGHTPVRWPLRLGTQVYLDLGAYTTGQLALLPLDPGAAPRALILQGPGQPERLHKFASMGEPLPAQMLR